MSSFIRVAGIGKEISIDHSNWSLYIIDVIGRVTVFGGKL